MPTQSLTPTGHLPTITEGDDVAIPVTYSDPSGTAIDITNWTVSLTIAEADGTPIIEKDNTTHDNATGGETSFALTSAETANLDGTKRFDIQHKDQNGEITTDVLGTVGFVDGMTDRTV